MTAFGDAERPRRPRPPSIVTILGSMTAVLIVLALALATAGAAWVAWREFVTVEAERLAGEAAGPTALGDVGAVDGLRTQCAGDCPQRAALAAAVVRLARAADLRPGPERRRLLDEGQALLAPLDAVPSLRGDASIWSAYGRTVDDRPGFAVQAPAALDRSYERMRFSRSWALWRLSYAGGHWAEIAPATRTAVLTEAIWLESVAPKSAPQIEDALSAPSPSIALTLARLRTKRTAH